MSIFYNQTEIPQTGQNISFNSTTLSKVDYNQTTVWTMQDDNYRRQRVDLTSESAEQTVTFDSLPANATIIVQPVFIQADGESAYTVTTQKSSTNVTVKVEPGCTFSANVFAIVNVTNLGNLENDGTKYYTACTYQANNTFFNCTKFNGTNGQMSGFSYNVSDGNANAKISPFVDGVNGAFYSVTGTALPNGTPISGTFKQFATSMGVHTITGTSGVYVAQTTGTLNWSGSIHGNYSYTGVFTVVVNGVSQGEQNSGSVAISAGDTVQFSGECSFNLTWGPDVYIDATYSITFTIT